MNPIWSRFIILAITLFNSWNKMVIYIRRSSFKRRSLYTRYSLCITVFKKRRFSLKFKMAKEGIITNYGKIGNTVLCMTQRMSRERACDNRTNKVCGGIWRYVHQTSQVSIITFKSIHLAPFFSIFNLSICNTSVLDMV